MTEMTTIDFGQAIRLLKEGKSVCRAGWNGKGVFVYLNKGNFAADLLGFKPGDDVQPDHPSTLNGVSIGLFEAGGSGTVTRMPNINMRAADGSTVVGWLASQTDILATDWMLVE